MRQPRGVSVNAAAVESSDSQPSHAITLAPYPQILLIAFESGALSSARSAGRPESYMKFNHPLWNLLGKRQGEENLLRNTFMSKRRDVSEPETLVVLRIAHKRTAFCAHLFQHRQPFLDQGFPDALLLNLWQHRNRAEAVPVG